MVDELNKNREISTKIRRFRESKDYTQEYMARKLNISQNSYSRLEKEPENMSLKRLEDICQILEVGLREVIDSKESSVYYNKNEAEYQNSYGNIIIHNYPQELMEKMLDRLEKMEGQLNKK